MIKNRRVGVHKRVQTFIYAKLLHTHHFLEHFKIFLPSLDTDFT